MKIEVWFDFNHQESYQQMKAIEELLHEYVIEDLELLYRSYPLKHHEMHTYDAHRLSHLAKKYHAQHEFNLSLCEAIQHENKDIADQEFLKNIAVKNYLDGKMVYEVLSSNAYFDQVESNLENALFKKIHSIPHIRIEGKIKLDGYHSKDAMIEALNTAKATLKTNEHCIGEHCGRKKAH
ncbi:MAG: DsbA family protein [Acholeplasmataceae bacterium]|nr:DsbA family protein [Acholeplasmataceae bacterium]